MNEDELTGGSSRDTAVSLANQLAKKPSKAEPPAPKKSTSSKQKLLVGLLTVLLAALLLTAEDEVAAVGPDPAVAAQLQGELETAVESGSEVDLNGVTVELEREGSAVVGAVARDKAAGVVCRRNADGATTCDRM